LKNKYKIMKCTFKILLLFLFVLIGMGLGFYSKINNNKLEFSDLTLSALAGEFFLDHSEAQMNAGEALYKGMIDCARWCFDRILGVDVYNDDQYQPAQTKLFMGWKDITINTSVEVEIGGFFSIDAGIKMPYSIPYCPVPGNSC
jgi:hypothetical protein